MFYAIDIKLSLRLGHLGFFNEAIESAGKSLVMQLENNGVLNDKTAESHFILGSFFIRKELFDDAKRELLASMYFLFNFIQFFIVVLQAGLFTNKYMEKIPFLCQIVISVWDMWKHSLKIIQHLISIFTNAIQLAKHCWEMITLSQLRPNSKFKNFGMARIL